MRDVGVHLLPVELLLRVLPRVDRERESLDEEPLAVGLHLLHRGDAQLVVGRARPTHAAEDPVSLGVRGRATQDHRGGAGTECERRERLAELRARRLLVFESVEGALLRLAGAFGGDDERVVDLSGVEHRPGELHRVDEPEARVRHVEVEAARRQPERVVDLRRDRRLDVGARHRRVDEEADLIRLDPGRLQGEPTRGDRAVDVSRLVRPPAPRRHSGQRLELAACHADPRVRRRESIVDRVGGDDLRCFDRLDREDGGVGQAVAGIAVHQWDLPCRRWVAAGRCGSEIGGQAGHAARFGRVWRAYRSPLVPPARAPRTGPSPARFIPWIPWPGSCPPGSARRTPLRRRPARSPVPAAAGSTAT